MITKCNVTYKCFANNDNQVTNKCLVNNDCFVIKDFYMINDCYVTNNGYATNDYFDAVDFNEHLRSKFCQVNKTRQNKTGR